MNHNITLLSSAALLLAGALATQAMAAEGPSDAEIAHIAYTAGAIDAAAARQALATSHNAEVRGFAEVMLRDHEAVNAKALALVKKLGVTPADNGTSQALSKQATEAHDRLAKLSGATFDRAYVQNEVAYHRTVNGALKDALIPSADNGELKSLLQAGATLFGEHQAHAEMLAAKL
jgi:putative membrane protein